jgi:hypothetical protein
LHADEPVQDQDYQNRPGYREDRLRKKHRQNSTVARAVPYNKAARRQVLNEGLEDPTLSFRKGTVYKIRESRTEPRAALSDLRKWDSMSYAG